ncbi:MAG: chemotaxis response regulator protein-glutamate methylesterase [Rubripirellula sp.]
MKLRAIVVDDSLIFRKVVRDCLGQLRGVEVIDVAKDGMSALDKIIKQRPDIVTLDVEMPVLDGLEVLKALQREKVDSKVIMVSSHTERGAATTTRALSIGAFDFILKPNLGSMEENQRELKEQLGQRIDLLRRRTLRSIGKDASPARPRVEAPVAKPVLAKRKPTRIGRLDAICIGISTGGPKALSELISSLPAEINIPILIVQHMPPLFTATLARGLHESSQLKVVEAEDGMPLKGGVVYIAPGGRQMRVGGYAGAWTTEITDDEAVKACKPSVDYLFSSAAQQFRSKMLAIVMTGMGDDGLVGCRKVAERGGVIWSQDQASSTVFGMPRQIAQAGLADEVRSLREICEGIKEHGCQRHLARV